MLDPVHLVSLKGPEEMVYLAAVPYLLPTFSINCWFSGKKSGKASRSLK